MSRQDWQSTRISFKMAETIYAGLRKINLESIQATYKNLGVHWITHIDDDYPLLLRETSDAPIVLYGRGNLTLLNKPSLAIVGTRVATVYGKRIAFQFARELAKAGACVVSGLASGIDTAAHEGSLDTMGDTIAVLGSSVERVYPAANRKLYDRIWEKGLILSEYPIGTLPHAGLFPMRNRIIAGISYGVLVVEAALRSGSFITVDCALEACRDVFAVPGPIVSPKSKGTLELIKQGAKMVTTIDDILEEYRADLFQRIAEQSEDSSAMTQLKSLTTDEQSLLQHLSTEPVTFDELLELLQYEFGQLHALLLSLLLKKRILQHPGMCYTLNN
jgi:DNA processing protein